jgi:hypothetical protein
MSGKGQFGVLPEDAHPRVAARGGGQNEGGLGMIELARDVLHLRVGDAGGVEEHRQRISFQRVLGKDIDLDKVEALAALRG